MQTETPTTAPNGRTAAERARILHQRAVELARKDERPDEDWVLTDVLDFTLAGQSFAVESAFVREVLQLRQLTPLPNIPDFIAGITSVRGHIFAVYDLRRFFAMPTEGITDFDRLILLRTPALEIGVLADAIREVRPISMGRLDKPPSPFPQMRPEHYVGIGENNLIVLDAQGLLADPRLIVNQSREISEKN